MQVTNDLKFSDSRKLGMLWEDEAQLLHRTVKERFQFEGALIDLGSFTGSSAYYMAQALESIAKGRDAKIHSHDQFTIMHGTGMGISFIEKNFGEKLSKGDSFRHIFDRNISPFKHLIETHECDFLKYKWTGGLVELLFIDIAKTQSLNSKVITEYFTHLEPERSIVFHQDFHWPALPWITVTMHLMNDFFDLFEDKANTTRAWTCKKTPDTEIINKCVEYRFSKADELAIVSEFIEEESAMGRETLPFEIMKLRLGSKVNEFNYEESIQDFKGKFEGNKTAAHWEKHFLTTC